MNNVCQQHGNEMITHICIVNHDCQKLMCPKCQYSHQLIVPGWKILPISNFNEKMNSTIGQYSSVDQSKTEKEMKMHFEEILEQIYKLSDKAHQKFNFLFEEINQRDNSYLQLFQRDPLEISLKDLRKISNIWHNQILEKWQKQKEIIIQIIQKKVNLIYNFLWKFIDILENQISQSIEEISTTINDDSPFSYESIQFPVFFGIKHGQTFSKRLGMYEEYGQIKLNKNIDLLNQKGFILQKQKLKLTPFQIKKLEDDGQIQYSKDGVILKTEKIPNINQSYVINKNLEQVKHLSWEGSQGQNLQKIGLWNAFWQGKDLGIGGLYDEDGYKTEQWIELSDIYQSQCQVTETGLYQKGKKCGNWQIFYKGQRIGGGAYDDQQEIKVGVWKEIHQNFNKFNQSFNNSQCQIFYIGEYINGKKFGNWEIYFRDETSFQIKKIGGGLYDNFGDWKYGQWVELYSQFQDTCEYTQRGDYDEKGRREGKWDIYHNDKIIGGGDYGQLGKIGKWVDPLTNAITFEGFYKDGQRVGEWTIQYFNEKIGGGFYNQENGLKIYGWTELHEKYSKFCQVTYIGEYQMGKKLDFWQINNKNYQIGGGQYVDSQKSGKWIEVHENFLEQIISSFQIILDGEYNQGIKCGLWTTKLRESLSEQFMPIGEGYYQDGLKYGQWIELDLNYEKTNKVIYVGKYQDGKKIEIWDIKNNNMRIGGGKYLITGQKDGEWIELDDNFRNLCQIVNKGVYQNGKKVGNWVIQLIEENNKVVDIGGGQYNDQGKQIEIWTEIYQNFWRDCRVIFKGRYQDGRKQGIWNSYFQQNQNLNYEQFGGGCYNEGLKNGPWISFQETSWNPQQQIIVSQYSNGLQQISNQ